MSSVKVDTAADSDSSLPVFPFLGLAFRHDSIGLLNDWFSMKHFLPEAKVKKNVGLWSADQAFIS